MMTLGKRYRFSAAHQLWHPDWSEAQNEAAFGACARLHGHTYTLEVQVSGPPDTETGMVIQLPELDALVQHVLLDEVDHRHLDTDVSFITGHRSTVEVLSRLFFERLAPHVPLPAKLAAIRLYESPENWAEACAN
jgi:6-pyruvoyltetrahydropterin/6-carboxytetrahydropterin synthase